MSVDYEAIAELFAAYERKLGTGKVTTGAFASLSQELTAILESIRDDHSREVTLADSMNLDAFGRLRVSNPFTLFDGKTVHFNHPSVWDDVQASGSGTQTWYDEDRSSTYLIVAYDEAGVRVRQTYRRFAYVPGKSQLTLITFVHGELEDEISRKIGVFDDDNGIFLDTEAQDVYLTIRSSTSGGASDTRISQANWNIDQFDGDGPSGITLDLTKAQILVIDYEWLGVGRVRVGFNIDGVTYPAHQFKHANVINSVYMSTPNLPIRYEIESDGTGEGGKIGGDTALEAICSTVISEGGEDPVGRKWGAASAANRTGLNGTGATRYALFGLRLRTSAASSIIIPAQFSVVGTTVNDEFAWEIVLGGTVAGAPSWTNYTNSAAQYFDGTSSNTITGGQVLATGVGFSRSNITIDTRSVPGPGISYGGTPQEMHFVIRPYANMVGAGAINWIER